jgi:hypothetical protein
MIKIIKKYLKNKRIYIVIAIIIALALFAWFISFGNDQKTETGVEIVEVDNFQKELGLFEDALRNVWFSIETVSVEEMKNEISDAERRWIIIEENFSESQPKGFEKAREWPSMITKVSDSLKKSRGLIEEKKYPEAQKEINSIFRLIDSVKKENGQESFDLQLLDFYEILKKVSTAPSKEAAAVYLPELKIAYTFLKGVGFGSESAGIITKMENEIGVLDKSFYGPDFQKAQADLRQDFFALFLGN